MKYKLGDIAKTGSGGTPKSTVAEYYENGNIPWINSGELNNPFISTTSNFITQKGYDNSSAKLFPPQTVLLAMYGATAGKASLLEFEACTNQAICAIMPNQNILLPRFLKYKLDTMYNYLVGLSTGSARDNLSQDGIKALELCIPPLSEQKKIASVLSSLDDKIALNKKMNQKLERMAKRLYDYWFVQYDFPDKNGHPYKTTGGPMTYNPTLKREIPEGWEVKQICDIASFEKESVRPSDNPNIEYKHFSIPGYDECGSYVLEMGESILSDKFKVSETDILVSKLNPWTSRVIWGESQEHQICSTEFVVMKLHELKEKGFLYSLVKQPSFIDYCTRGSSGTSHSHRRVNPEYMMDYIFAYEKDAVQSFSAIVSRYALMMMKNLRENRRLTALRDKLLPLLMNGQVVVG